MTEYTISSKEEGLTVYKYASRILPAAPSGLIHKFLRNKNIELNGKKADGRGILKAGDKVAFFLSDETFAGFRGVSSKDRITGANESRMHLKAERILYEDDDYLFYDKPAGLRTQQDGSGRISLNDMLLEYTGCSADDACRPSVCNRLDTNTSGIVLCGKSIKGLQTLSAAIKERRIEKYYRAVLCGIFSEEEKKAFDHGLLHISAYLGSAGNGKRMDVSETEKEGYTKAETELSVLAENEGFTYAELKLVTGRKHQIRVQTAYIGHPVAGDINYGRQGSKGTAVKRQMLHSYRTVLPEEILSGMTIVAPLPEDMRKCLERAGIDANI